MAAGEGGAPTREGGRRPGRRSAVLVAVAVLGCVVAAALAYSTITRPTTDPRIDIAAGQAIAVAEDVTTTLTTEAEDRRYLDDDLFESEMVAFVDERVGDALVEQGDGRVVWSKFILASADNLAGGWPPRSTRCCASRSPWTATRRRSSGWSTPGATPSRRACTRTPSTSTCCPRGRLSALRRDERLARVAARR